MSLSRPSSCIFLNDIAAMCVDSCHSDLNFKTKKFAKYSLRKNRGAFVLINKFISSLKYGNYEVFLLLCPLSYNCKEVATNMPVLFWKYRQRILKRAVNDKFYDRFKQSRKIIKTKAVKYELLLSSFFEIFYLEVLISATR